MACDSIFKSPTILYFDTFDHVFKAVESGMCQYGILPIENSTAGSVNAIYDLMIQHNFSIVRSVRLKVSHNLLAKHGTKLGDIREVFSHEQAISQCADYLAGMKNIKVTMVENTAVAARMVAQSDRTDVAATSSSLLWRGVWSQSGSDQCSGPGLTTIPGSFVSQKSLNISRTGPYLADDDPAP